MIFHTRDGGAMDSVCRAREIAAEMTRIYRPRDVAFIRPGFARGIDYYSQDGLVLVLNNVIQGYHKFSGRFPDILRPRLYSEKLSALKFLAHIKVPESGNKLMTECFLPSEARSYVSIPEIVWSSNTAILPPNSALPAGDYYIKTNHGSGRCRRIRYPLPTDNRAALELMASHWLARGYGEKSGEWWYNVFQRRLLIERSVTMRNPSAVISFYVFRGQICLIVVEQKFLDGTNRALSSMYDKSFQPILNEKADVVSVSDVNISVEMRRRAILAAEVIGRNFAAVRVDILPGDNEELYLNELTLTPKSGRPPSTPGLDEKMGSIWGACDFMEY